MSDLLYLTCGYFFSSGRFDLLIFVDSASGLIPYTQLALRIHLLHLLHLLTNQWWNESV